MVKIFDFFESRHNHYFYLNFLGNNNNAAGVVPSNSNGNIRPNQNGQPGRVQTTTRRATTKAQKKPQTNKQ
jgi:hypothetical protein